MSEQGFPKNKPLNMTKAPSLEKIAAMALAYSSGKSANAVGNEFGVTAPTVLKWAFRSGVKLRKRGYPPKLDTTKIEAAMRESGTTHQQDIADKLGVTIVTARSAVRRAGFKEWRDFVRSIGLRTCKRKSRTR